MTCRGIRGATAVSTNYVEDILQATRKMLEESIVASSEVFSARKFFLSDEFSLVDCSIAPILWRLHSYGIDLSEAAQPISKYMDTVFSRQSFQESLTELEQEMRQ